MNESKANRLSHGGEPVSFEVMKMDSEYAGVQMRLVILRNKKRSCAEINRAIDQLKGIKPVDHNWLGQVWHKQAEEHTCVQGGKENGN